MRSIQRRQSSSRRKRGRSEGQSEAAALRAKVLAALHEVRGMLKHTDAVLAQFRQSYEKIYPGNEQEVQRRVAMDADIRARNAKGHIATTMKSAARYILTTYKLTPKERRAMEAAAKHFDSPPRRGIDGFAALKSYAEWVDVAIRAVERGEVCGADAVCSRTCFRVVDAGGFGPAGLARASAAAEKAQELLREHGLGELCYGDIYVVGSIRKGKNITAFYEVASDKLYVIAKLPPWAEKTFFLSLLHEIGHRFEFKFASREQTEAIKSVYWQARRSDGVLETEGLKRPEPGDLLMTGPRAGYRVTSVTGDLVSLESLGSKKTATTSLQGWYRMHGAIQTGGGFITKYAETSPSENFAELFSYFLVNRLSGAHLEEMKKILRR